MSTVKFRNLLVWRTPTSLPKILCLPICSYFLQTEIEVFNNLFTAYLSDFDGLMIIYNINKTYKDFKVLI